MSFSPADGVTQRANWRSCGGASRPAFDPWRGAPADGGTEAKWRRLAGVAWPVGRDLRTTLIAVAVRWLARLLRAGRTKLVNLVLHVLHLVLTRILLGRDFTAASGFIVCGDQHHRRQAHPVPMYLPTSTGRYPEDHIR